MGKNLIKLLIAIEHGNSWVKITASNDQVSVPKIKSIALRLLFISLVDVITNAS